MNPRAIVVRVKGDAGGLKIINEFNAASDPLHFVLLFPRGELGPSIFFARIAASTLALNFFLCSKSAFTPSFLGYKKKGLVVMDDRHPV